MKIRLRRPVHLAIRAQNVDRFAHVAGGKSFPYIGKHFFQDRGHMGQVTRVLRIKSGIGRLCAAGKAEKKVANTLQPDHKLHASQQLAGLSVAHLGDIRGDAGIYFSVQIVELFFALTQAAEKLNRTGGDAFRCGSCGFLGKMAGFGLCTSLNVNAGIRTWEFQLARCSYGHPSACHATARWIFLRPVS